MYRTILLIILLFSLPCAPDGFCATNCVDAEGEAAITGNDIPSARTEAIARAKWAAIEQSVGVEVKAQSVVQNMALVDDAVSKQIRGVVAGHKLLKEENRGNSYFVRINACVEPTNAREMLSSLALNNNIALFIPANKPRERYAHDTREEWDETNILSETVIGALAEQGYTVVDVAPSRAVDASEIDRAIKSGNFTTLRSLMYKFLSNIIIIGKVEYTVSTRRGQDIGYGMSMPFNNVTVRLAYRIVTRDGAGKTVILAAGVEEAKGMATNAEDATAKGLKGIADKFTPIILEKITRHIKGIAKKVAVTVDGVGDMNAHFAVKEKLTNIAWVTGVEEKSKSGFQGDMNENRIGDKVSGLGEFIVSYPENPIYLANSLQQKGVFKIKVFSPYAIRLQYLE